MGVPVEDFHLPTGYVIIEDIVRFCIEDLGARPRTDDWESLCKKGEQNFFDEWGAKKTSPPG